MKLHRDEPAIRVTGSLVAVCFLFLGYYALTAATPDVPDLNRDRAFWFGVTCLVAGFLAIVLTWTIKDIRGVWCAPPQRRFFGD
jgi:hypothetical protein